ncbi:unnamed protein product [Clavelina lepadiformis]|uniref:Intraflagellar transport protein 56 n=1 Tax=Clavelina lepadiformis TaxID=159417 RepID=A0ABP0GVG1_CLALP
MILSRQKPVGGGTYTGDKTKKKKIPKFEDFVEDRDYTGAITVLEFNQQTGKANKNVDLWLAYCYFHLAEFKKAFEIYSSLIKKADVDPSVYLYCACCCFYMGWHKEAESLAQKGPDTSLKNRLLFHISHKLHRHSAMMSYHSKLGDEIDDKLCYTSIQFLRSHYREAMQHYNHQINLNKDYHALQIYAALCAYKLEYYEYCIDHLAEYLQYYPDSAIASNLKACVHFRLYDGKAAEGELKHYLDVASPSAFGSEFINHNKVIFRRGESALQILPPLVGIIPEAKLNLALYYFTQEEYLEAFQLVEFMEPATPNEYVIKGAIYAGYGQEESLRHIISMAQQCYHKVGSSADTLVGRQCTACSNFLTKNFEQVVVYLDSIKGYLYGDDVYNFNYAQAKAACGNYKDAEDIFIGIKNERLKSDYVYTSWLARCYIMNKRPQLAWELYNKMETSSDSFSLLHLIANDCYRTRQYYIAAKAFDLMERLDSNPEYWEGKRGACVGLFQMIISGDEPRETIQEVILMLRGTTSNPQVEYIIRTIGKWAKEHQIPLK